MHFVSEFNGDRIRPTCLFSPKHPITCLMHRELVLGDAAKDNHRARIDGQAFVFPFIYSAWQVFVFALLLLHKLKVFFAVALGVKGVRERRRGISLFHGPPCRGDFKGMVRLRFLIIYPQRFGTEVITTVLLLLLFPDIGFCARSRSVHGMVQGENTHSFVCDRYEAMVLAKEKRTKKVVQWEASMNAWHGKDPGGGKGEKHYCTYIHRVGLQSPHLNGLLFSPRHTE